VERRAQAIEAALQSKTADTGGKQTLGSKPGPATALGRPWIFENPDVGRIVAGPELLARHPLASARGPTSGNED
jgi:hypothetical protein